MIFLAHLSFDNKELQLGNLIADHIVTNKYHHYPKEIQKGIILHRKIDTFTDKHAIVKLSKRRLHKQYGHYDGIIIDIFYDYFLAKNWNKYHQTKLGNYTNNFYKLLQKYHDILPEKTKTILPSLTKKNWLYNYQFLDGIESVLIGMNKRTKGKSKMHLAINDLKELENEFEIDFNLFFNELINYCQTEILNT